MKENDLPVAGSKSREPIRARRVKVTLDLLLAALAFPDGNRIRFLKQTSPHIAELFIENSSFDVVNADEETPLYCPMFKSETNGRITLSEWGDKQ